MLWVLIRTALPRHFQRVPKKFSSRNKKNIYPNRTLVWSSKYFFFFYSEAELFIFFTCRLECVFTVIKQVIIEYKLSCLHLIIMKLEICISKPLSPQLYACPYKMPKLKREISLAKLIWFFKVNQVIYSSAPISSQSFKILDQLIIEISCWHDLCWQEMCDKWTDSLMGKHFWTTL